MAEPIYVALRPIASDKTIHFCATDGTTNYRKSVTSKTLERNSIYPVNLSTTETTGTALEFLTASYEAQDGETLSGILLGKYAISTASTTGDATITVTLNGVDINHHYPISIHAPGINCQGNINLVLADGSVNYITASIAGYAGIFITGSRTLTISGNGSLTATGKGNSSSSSDRKCGYITISNGNVTATGGQYGAGIGCSKDGSCTDGIEISGTADVTATGGDYGAGIGSTYAVSRNSSCGDILIDGTATVKATGGEYAAGIGSGRGTNSSSQSICGTITIKSDVTSVIATKGNPAYDSIGKGTFNSECGAVFIEYPSKVTQN